MIRQATMLDKIPLLKLAKAFYAASNLVVEFDVGYTSSYIESFILAEDKLVVVLEYNGKVEGALLAHLTQLPFNPDFVATEDAWWVSEEIRGWDSIKLIRYYEDWAKLKGCTIVGLTSLANTGEPSKVCKAYSKLGFQLVESHYLKVFD